MLNDSLIPVHAGEAAWNSIVYLGSHTTTAFDRSTKRLQHAKLWILNVTLPVLAIWDLRFSSTSALSSLLRAFPGERPARSLDCCEVHESHEQEAASLGVKV